LIHAQLSVPDIKRRAEATFLVMKKSVYFGLSLALAVMSCSPPGGKLGEDLGITYLPLRDGQKYTYSRQYGDESEQFSVELKFVEGDLASPEFRVINRDGRDTFLRRQRDAVVCLTDAPLGRLQELPAGQLYLSTWLLDGATAGVFWEDDETGLRSAVAGFESVTTPAGTFDDCIKITVEPTDILLEVMRLRAEQQGRSPHEIAAELHAAAEVRVRWFARGAGLVKETHGNCLLELVSYNRR